ncbi:unnamed protein product [Lota lota]
MQRDPSQQTRRRMVRVVNKEMRRFEENPTIAQCLTIAEAIVNQHPKSFEDTLDDGKTMIGGHSSLLSQLKTRVEHVHRNNTLAQRPTVTGATGVKEKEHLQTVAARDST